MSTLAEELSDIKGVTGVGEKDRHFTVYVTDVTEDVRLQVQRVAGRHGLDPKRITIQRESAEDAPNTAQ